MINRAMRGKGIRDNGRRDRCADRDTAVLRTIRQASSLGVQQRSNEGRLASRSVEHDFLSLAVR
jgi:hypothetical protein